MLRCLYFYSKQDCGGPQLERFRIESSVRIVNRPLNTYKLHGKQRGLVIIFNYVSFDDPTFSHSGGTDKDSANLKYVFQQMNYQVQVCTDLTKRDTLIKLNDITKRDNIDSLVLFFLSHGKSENNFYTHDIGSSLNVNDILFNFSNTNCPGMRGKPKILLFNFGGGNILQSNLKFDSTPKREREVPTDMTIVQASQRGIMSRRSISTGTLFVDSLCKILCEFALTKDIHDIVMETAQLMQNENGTTATYTSIDMTKKFYFM